MSSQEPPSLANSSDDDAALPPLHFEIAEDASPPPDTPTPVTPTAEPMEETQLLEDLRVVLTRHQEQQATGQAEDDLAGRQVGHYLVQRLLGEGGMARVYRATDLRTHKPVAFKILKSQYRADPRLCTRFEREARSMARIRHRNVVRILDFPSCEAARAIVMAFVPGGSLRKLANRSRLAGRQHSIPECVDLLIQAAEGVEAAHRLGMVHRDIKPSNLLVDSRGRIQVADFGAILVTEGTTWLTGVGQQIGTPAYMSPEQCQGHRVGPASDVYSLGVTLFELLTNRLPFEAEESSPFAIMLKHISEPAPDPRKFRTEISQELAGVVVKSLAKSPEDRYPAAGAFAEALKTIPLLCPALAVGPQDAGDRLQVDIASIRKHLEKLPQRAIVCWACRCARRVQHLNRDPRVERALAMAESSLAEPPESTAQHAVSSALSRIHALRLASLKAAYADENAQNSRVEPEAARAAAAAASSAAAVCIGDCAADAAYAARSAIAALHLAEEPIRAFWDAARSDYHTLANANLGEEGTVGQPIPPALFVQ